MAVINSEWNPNTDIYDIVESVDSLKKRYIDDENETTLAVGIFGFLGDTEAKKIQTTVMMTGELGNEMFATRAKLTKNILTHAAYSSIQNINATPAQITMNIGLSLNDLELYFKNNEFTLDSYSAIFVGNYEFHTDYDIVINRSKKATGSSIADMYSYTARYKMLDDDGNPIENRLSGIRNQYIMQPFVTNLDNTWYLVFQAVLHQYSIETTSGKIITDSVIANKSYTFTFDNQLADFDVYITRNGETKKLRPYLYGTDIGQATDYCWYLYTNDNTCRVTFDNLSFIPALNDDIKVVAYTCLGYNGNFEYIKIDNKQEGFYYTLTSKTYNYSNLNCFSIAVTDSVYGLDMKSKAELKTLIPKASMARGSLTTEKDVTNYFNLIENEDNRLVMQKKIDNQLTRVWYAYLLLKDQVGNVIPTNTINIHLDLTSPYWTKSPDGRIVIPAGAGIIYNKDTMVGEIIDIADIPTPVDNEEYYGDNYYYSTFYSIVLDRDPLYSAFYCTCVNEVTYFTFRWINTDTPTQFVANRVTYKRNLLTDQYIYRFKFAIAQSLLVDFGLYTREEEMVIKENDEGEEYYAKEIIETVNIKAILVLYNSSDVPYRWKECEFEKDKYIDDGNYIFDFSVDLVTDNGLDDKNQIKINDMYVRGTRELNYGYFPPEAHARIYVLARFDSQDHDPTERGVAEDCLDTIAPGYNDWVVTNIYDFQDKVHFFDNYTDVIDAKVTSLDVEGLNFRIDGIPVVGGQYINIDFDDVEDNAAYLMDVVTEKKSYIDYCINLLEDNMDVDFKLFNTYGPSSTYVNEDGTPINHVDLTLNFQISLKFASDYATKDNIIAFIKDKIEDLYDTGDLHIPNLITDVTNNFSDYINYIEFIGYNTFSTDTQHIIKKEVVDPTTVPEFLNIRNVYEGDAKNLIPCIHIDIV